MAAEDQPSPQQLRPRSQILSPEAGSAAMALGMQTVPVVCVDVTEAQAKALNLSLNRIQGEWDLPKLGDLLEELRNLAGLEREQLPQPYEESFDLAAEMPQAQRQSASAGDPAGGGVDVHT
jgi:hypothetical protein